MPRKSHGRCSWESNDLQNTTSESNDRECLIISQHREAVMSREVAIYCERGWSTHPLNSKKRPILKNWQSRATTNSNIFMQWLKQWPGANVGIITGETNNLLVLDVDGLEGLNSIKELELPEAPTVVTSRGHHYYFQFPKVLSDTPTTRAGLLPGIDTRGRGGFIVAPPSIHETGHQYYWSTPLDNNQLPDAPMWLIQHLIPPERAPYKKPHLALGMGSRYAHTALRNETVAVATAPSGTRNMRLNQAAFSMGTLVAAGSIDLSQVAEALAQAALSSGLSRREIEKTLSSGISAGMLRPREVCHG